MIVNTPVNEAEDPIMRFQWVGALEWLGKHSSVIPLKQMAGTSWASEGIFEDQYRSWSCCQIARPSEYGENTLRTGYEVKFQIQDSKPNWNVGSELITKMMTRSAERTVSDHSEVLIPKGVIFSYMMVVSRLLVSNAKASMFPIPGKAYGMMGGVLPSPERHRATFDLTEVMTRVNRKTDTSPVARETLRSHRMAAIPWSRISLNMSSRRFSGYLSSLRTDKVC